jgi:hypothetical protein
MSLATWWAASTMRRISSSISRAMLVGVVRLGLELAAEERLAAVVAEDAQAELLAHAEAHDHLLGRRGDLLEVVRGARGDLAEDDLLGGAAAEVIAIESCSSARVVRNLSSIGMEIV